MKVDLPVEYCPSSSTLGLASKSPSLSSGLGGEEEEERSEGRQQRARQARGEGRTSVGKITSLRQQLCSY